MGRAKEERYIKVQHIKLNRESVTVDRGGKNKEKEKNFAKDNLRSRNENTPGNALNSVRERERKKEKNCSREIGRSKTARWFERLLAATAS